MKRNIELRTGIIIAVVLICIYGIVGIPKSKAELIANWKKNIHLGLDLRGGSHLVLQVQLQDAFMASADQVMERLKAEAVKQNVTVGSTDRNELASLDDADKIQINIHGVPSNNSSAFRSLVSNEFPDWILTPVNSTDYRMTIKPSSALKLKDDTLTQTMHTIERKINGLGLTESSVQQRGRADAEAELLVQMPGVDDPGRVRQILQTQAMLELYEVKDGPFASREEVLAKHGGVLPLNTKLFPAQARAGNPAGWYLLARSPVIRGNDLRDAHASQGEMGRWETNFVLTQDAARRFEQFTGANIGNRLAIVLDGQVISAPTIQARIGDTGVITGASSQEEAADLALNLRAGSLPARVVFEDERTVGPSLGNDSIHEGFRAGIFGVLAVVIAMLLYYKGAGINATLALILNAVILIAALSYFDATLTLPGIAGIILTIGMAVDSNVLIFERVREELRAGKGTVAALDAGFSKAFLTIIDTHVTTIVSCAFLFLFGTGPVKGFAVTLVIGLFANVFTAVFVSKTIFDWELSRKRVATLSI
ncbi:MAG TPA: protein translocase subunit SecD [Verrucomicrobiae bacterium]|nr:protein translocase subunit SecD [Bryobacteraceae bacterium]HXU20025.1 protein translocase subunit SecD [Verrucomicrobiae bacterium]